MSVNDWLSWALSVIVTGVDWLRTCTIMSVPILYWLIGVFVMGVVIRAIPFRA